MTYTEAVQKALNGEERGFGFLYENTYKSKLYLCLQYMKNESDAEDVLQDAYVKAFSNLQDLKDPEKFSSWLGQIVANTAKNALVKKNPVLFSYIPMESDEDESFEEQIEDENVSNQPELSYTREETRQMVQELIDSLSDEQRMCILMYHMEDMPIKDIASALDCSESTVKSRLSYGRKNLKAKAEEMQKKGYNLYSLAPLALLLLLLHTDAQAMYTEPAFLAAGRQISNHVFSQISSLGYGTGPGNAGTSSGTASEANSGIDSRTTYGTNSGQTGAADSTATSGAISGAEGAAKSGAGKNALAGILSTRAGQILIGAIGAAVVVGSGFGIATVVRDSNDNSADKKQGGEVVVVQEPEESTVQEETVEVEPQETEENTSQVRSVTDDMYPELLKGNLTKSEFQYALAYGPESMSESGLSNDDFLTVVVDICGGFYNGSLMFPRREDPDPDQWRTGYDVNKLDRFLSVYVDNGVTRAVGLLYLGEIDGDTLWCSIPELNYDATADITEAYYTDDEMIVYYHFHKVLEDPPDTYTTDNDKAALLKKQSDGKYQIVRIGLADEISMID